MAPTPTKTPPPWSAAIHIMSRQLCRICGHLHPGGCFGKNECTCCRNDSENHGWAGH